MKETRRDDWKRTDRLLYDLADTALRDEEDCEFADVVWDGLVHSVDQKYPPAGHSYPTRDSK